MVGLIEVVGAGRACLIRSVGFEGVVTVGLVVVFLLFADSGVAS